MKKLERINKYLSEAGVCIRREVDNLIRDARVEVNGVAARIGQVIDTEHDSVSVDGEKVDPEHPERNAIDAVALAEARPQPWWEVHNAQKAEREAAQKLNPKSKLLRKGGTTSAPRATRKPKSEMTARELADAAARRAENRRPKTFAEALSDKQVLMNVKTRRVEGVNPKAKTLRGRKRK